MLLLQDINKIHSIKVGHVWHPYNQIRNDQAIMSLSSIKIVGLISFSPLHNFILYNYVQILYTSATEVEGS